MALFSPMPLGQRREPFDHPDWFFELKYDGFRALLAIGSRRPEFISRNANNADAVSDLALFIDRELDAHAVLDGEVVCFDREGRPRFYDLMFGRGLRASLRSMCSSWKVVTFESDLSSSGRKFYGGSFRADRRMFSSPTTSTAEGATSTGWCAPAISKASWQSGRPRRIDPP
jgi:hypothetical protein